MFSYFLNNAECLYCFNLLLQGTKQVIVSFQSWVEKDICSSLEKDSNFRDPMNTAVGKRQATAVSRFSPNLHLAI